MNHVPLSWLRVLNLAYIFLAVAEISLYLFSKYVPPASFLLPYVGDSLIPSIICGVVLLYNILFVRLVRRKNASVASFATYFLLVVALLIATRETGNYTSHYFYVIPVTVFFAGMIGLYAALTPIVVQLLIIAFIAIGIFNNENSVAEIAVVCGTVWLSAITGWILWRRWYEKPTTSSNSSDAEGLLNKERTQTSAILSAIEDGVIIVDAQKSIRLFNPAAMRITGWTSGDAIGLDHHSVMKLADAKQQPFTDDDNPLVKVFQTKQSLHENNAVLLKEGGTPVYLDITVSPLLDQNKTVYAAVAIFRDVSTQRGEEARRAEFISTASHEMRTPVAAIEGYLALALNDKVSTIDSRAKSYLEKAHTSTQLLGKLFQDLLTSAKAEDGRLTSHPAVMEMGEFLEKLTDDLRFAAEKKGLMMEFVYGNTPHSGSIDARGSVSGGSKVVRPLYYTFADPDRLREVITNLFDNAVKYTESGKISIGITGDTKVVQMYVQDTGHGIPPGDIPHLFQKFYRVDSTATRTVGGTGLGLFICRKIIELYKGRIWVESTLGRGSTFYINLPRLSPDQAAVAKSSAPFTQVTAQPTQQAVATQPAAAATQASPAKAL